MNVDKKAMKTFFAFIKMDKIATREFDAFSNTLQPIRISILLIVEDEKNH